MTREYDMQLKKNEQSINIGDLLRKARETETPQKTDSSLLFLEDKAYDLFTDRPKDVEKLYKDITTRAKKIVKADETITGSPLNPNRLGEEENKIVINLEDILCMCAKMTLSIMAKETKEKVEEAKEEAEQGKIKPKVKYFVQGESWRAPEDWELHYQYILEIFNPKMTVYGPEKPEKDLEPGERLTDDPKSFGPRPNNVAGFFGQVFFQLAKVGHWILYQEFPDTPKLTIRESEQLHSLDQINVADAPSANNPNGVVNAPSLHLEVQKIFLLMVTRCNECQQGVQSDKIIELYEGPDKFKHRDSEKITFFYRYTGFERRAPLIYNLTQKNDSESREGRDLGDSVVSLLGSLGSFSGQIISTKMKTTSRLGLQLYPAVVFSLPQKCQ